MTPLKLQITSREPFADGTTFGDVGSYEKICGSVFFTIDSEAPGNQGVNDLVLAPRNKSSYVECSNDFCILKPADLSRGNHRLIYDVVNRGNKRILQFMNDAIHSNDPCDEEHAGNGFLMRRGYTIVWSGWQGDLLPGDGRLTMKVPVAKRDGEEITGLVRSEFIADRHRVVSFPLCANEYTSSYEALTSDTGKAKFTYREHEDHLRRPIAPGEWQFARLDEHGEPVQSTKHCYLPSGFRPGWIYELVYIAKNPLVLVLGFVGVRDFASFLLHSDVDYCGTQNPLIENGGGIEKAYAWGRSQGGRFLRAFVHQGFNGDARGRRVFNAIFPHVSSGGCLFLDHRFAMPSSFPRKHEEHLFPSDQFPFVYTVTRDPLTGKTDGVMKRPDTDPFVMHTQTSSEYWQRRGSLIHTNSSGEDLEPHEKVRIYLFSSSQHFADPNTGPQLGAHLHPSNPLNTTPLLRALLDALDAWVTNGTPPPESHIPRRADGTLVEAREVSGRFPSIQGVVCPDEPNLVFVQDHGEDFDKGIITKEPPELDMGREYTVLVPKVDADGNEAPGIRVPHVEVPLATFTGWNYRPRGMAEKALSGVTGSYFPFAMTASERIERGDQRPSIEERYPTKAHYVRAIAASAQRLVEQRLLLEEDADRYVELAINGTDLWALVPKHLTPFKPH